jgi:hypothetical protein
VLDSNGDGSDDLGVCLQLCQDDAVCRGDEGYACLQTRFGSSVCMAESVVGEGEGEGEGESGSVGDACGSDGDCSDADGACLLDASLPGGYCSQDCSADGRCPRQSSCIGFDTDGDQVADLGACLADCEGQRDCRRGYDCLDEGVCWVE